MDLEEPQVNHDEQLPDVVSILENSTDIFENDEHDEECIQYDMENDEHDEVDYEEDDQCYSMSLLNALQDFSNDDSDVSNNDIFDDLDNNHRAADDDEEDGWHSASEQCSQEDWNIGSEDVDYYDMEQWL